LLEQEEQQQPFFESISSRLYSIFQQPSSEEKRDLSGDIAPGSLESPQMLPRAAAPETFVDAVAQRFNAVFGGQDVETRNFGYEGKELELRRPEGMRHWNS
jgi:hypothetical protein